MHLGSAKTLNACLRYQYICTPGLLSLVQKYQHRHQAPGQRSLVLQSPSYAVLHTPNTAFGPEPRRIQANTSPASILLHTYPAMTQSMTVTTVFTRKQQQIGASATSQKEVTATRMLQKVILYSAWISESKAHAGLCASFSRNGKCVTDAWCLCSRTTTLAPGGPRQPVCTHAHASGLHTQPTQAQSCYSAHLIQLQNKLGKKKKKKNKKRAHSL